MQFARAHGLLTAVKGGGHSLSGQSTCDGGLMIDLSPMKAIRSTRRAAAHGHSRGCCWRTGRKAQSSGVVTPLGTASDTGIAGLTLGGGIGRLMRSGACPATTCSPARSSPPTAGRSRPAPGEPGSVLGAARRRRQLRGRHELRVPAASARPSGIGRHPALSLQRDALRSRGVVLLGYKPARRSCISPAASRRCRCERPRAAGAVRPQLQRRCPPPQLPSHGERLLAPAPRSLGKPVLDTTAP